MELSDGALLELAGVTRDAALLADAAAVAPFRVPTRAGSPPANMPLSAAVVEAAKHGSVSGLDTLTLPLASSFVPGEADSAVPVLWSRAAASPLLLPLDATLEGIERAIEDNPTGARRVLAAIREGAAPKAPGQHAREEGGSGEAAPSESPKSPAGRVFVVGSALGIQSVTASQLLDSLLSDPATTAMATTELVRRLGPYAHAAGAYQETHEVNRPLRLGATSVLAHAVRWAALPANIRRMAP